MPEMQMPGGSEQLSSGGDPSPATTVPPRPFSPRRKPVIIADLNLNFDPPESDGEDGMLPPTPVDPSTRSFLYLSFHICIFCKSTYEVIAFSLAIIDYIFIFESLFLGLSYACFCLV